MEEELYYPCSENKGADQLHGKMVSRCRLLVFSRGGSDRKLQTDAKLQSSSITNDILQLFCKKNLVIDTEVGR